VPPQELLLGLSLAVLCRLRGANGSKDAHGHDEMQMSQGTAVGEPGRILSWTSTRHQPFGKMR